MHRYRDAIYYATDRLRNAAKEIIGGYILFPGRIKGNPDPKPYYLESIEEVNIGAFPLLPDSDDPKGEGQLLYAFLTDILTKPRAYDHISGSIPQKGLKYEPAGTPDPVDLVLVGFFKPENREAILSNRLYYVPAALGKGSINLVSGFEKTRYLLLHRYNEERMLLHLKEGGPKFFPKKALEDLGFTPSGDFYLGFEIESLESVKGIDPYAYRLERAGRYAMTPYFTTFERLAEE